MTWKNHLVHPNHPTLLFCTQLTAAFALALCFSTDWGIQPVSAQSMGYGTMGLRSDAGAESNPLTMVRREMVPMTRAADQFIKEKKYQEALAKLREADAVADGKLTDKVKPPPKTAYEVFTLERLRGLAAMGAGDTQLAAKSFEVVIDSGRLKAEEQAGLMEFLVVAFYNDKNHDKAQSWAQRYLQGGGTSSNVRTLLVRSQYLSGNYTSASAALSAEIAADEAAGRVPPLEKLTMLGSSYVNLNDHAGYVQTLERLVTYYPKKEYWADLIARYQVKPGVAPRLLIDYDRLRLATGNAGDARSTMAMARRAIQAGFPAEARKIVNDGYQRNVLGTGSDAADHQVLRDTIDRLLIDDQKAMASADGRFKDADAQANTAWAYATLGQFDKSIALMEQAVAQGGLKHIGDAKLRLGMIYLQSGDKARALPVLQSLTDNNANNNAGNDGVADIARLWILYSKGGS